MNREADIVIVGAGPVGLFLGCCLRQRGLSFVVLEKRHEPSRQSRAIGIHPPALELLARAGLAEALIERGVRVRFGAGYCGKTRLGEVDFSRGGGAFGFVLSLPQRATERVFVEALPPRAIHRGVEVLGVTDAGSEVCVAARDADGDTVWRARFVAGCDGIESSVRGFIGSDFAGGDYPDCFSMGDFRDATGWGDEARIFVDSLGFVESFPLPEGLRRWVLHTGTDPAVRDALAFAAEIERRCAAPVGETREPLVGFSAQHFIASHFARGRVALAGDAAHVMSPMGGQGMNVGWLDAWDLAEAISQWPRDDPFPSSAYDTRARARAEIAIRRAGQNLAIGRGLGMPRLRTAMVAAALRLPIQSWIVNRFTLRGI
jgi:2-polyprenyl-6-methoxyphenol hydroxylase-like FAD-dependent oxidoreductase